MQKFEMRYLRENNKVWFVFIGPEFTEFTHFIFPLLEPKLQPNDPALLTQVINGVLIKEMSNYYFKTTRMYYFSGLYTAVLPDDSGRLRNREVIKIQSGK